MTVLRERNCLVTGLRVIGSARFHARFSRTKGEYSMRSPLAAPLGALFLLAACSGQSQTTDQPAKTEAANDENKLPDTGSGDPIELAAIEKGEMMHLAGEIGCAFTEKGERKSAG